VAVAAAVAAVVAELVEAGFDVPGEAQEARIVTADTARPANNPPRHGYGDLIGSW
jgi:hypothetical protein